MMQKLSGISALFFACAIMIPGANAASKSSDDIIYSVKRGDTLSAFASRYLISVNSYKIIQRRNRIANPRALPIGKKLHIPRNLLKYKRSTARLLSVRGNVIVSGARAKVGQIVGEGAKITTSAGSFVTMALGNGSRVSLPSNSGLSIRLLRNYVLGGTLDYEFDLAKGGAQSKVVPLKSGNDRFRMRTPKAVSAVRGTEFQARYDAERDLDFAEVVEGALAVGTRGAETALPAGKGLSVDAAGKARAENLLPAPSLIEPGKMQADPDLLFNAKPLPTEYGYRFTISKDAGFVEQVADKVVAAKQSTFTNIPNGTYFMRARAISESGIQGMPVTYSFKRRLNGISASTDTGENGYAFKWVADGEGVKKFHFQLFKNAPNGLAIVDEPALDSQEITMSDLLPGEYYWRVGSVQYLDGEPSTNWTSFEKLNISS